MGNTFITILPSAIGIAISPIPIVAVILILMSKRAKSNGLAFLAGWVIALFAVCGVVIWLATAGKISTGGEPSAATRIISFILGALLLLLAAKNWMSRPKSGQTPQTPKWMTAIDSFTASMSFGIAVVLAAVNPKNLLLVLSGALAIASASPPVEQEIVLAAVFTIIASLTIGAAVLYYLIAPTSASRLLVNMKAWLIRYNALIMAVLLLVIGLKIIIQSLQ